MKKKMGVKKPAFPRPSAAAKMPASPRINRAKKQVIPPDYDVILPGMGYTKPTKKNPPKKIKKK